MNTRFPNHRFAGARIAAALIVVAAVGGCDFADVAAAREKENPTVPSQAPAKRVSIATVAHAPGKTERRQADFSSEERHRYEKLSIASGADEIKLTPMEAAEDARGNAILSLRFDNFRERPKRLTLNVDGRIYAFGRHKHDPAWYSGWVDFDFDLFAREQAARGAFVARMKALRADDETAVSTFSGRELKKTAPLAAVKPKIIDTARNTSSAFSVDAAALAMVASDVSVARELMIIDKRVVNDQTRTFDICGNSGAPAGAWTFNTLMTRMANPGVSGISGPKFVRDWLENWTTSQVINGETVAARTDMQNLILNPWPKLPNGDLDLTKSPFRLLAIVNRVDLRKIGAGGLDAGEMRFVFGALDRTSPLGVCKAYPFIVILEYKVPIEGCQAVKNYANRWVALGDIAITDTLFNERLQSITDSITRAGAAPNSVNGSAISQIRTNEVLLGSPWQLREFRLGSSGHMDPFAVAQTPRLSRNNTALLTQYLSANSTSVLAHEHIVPFVFNNAAFRAGAITNNGSDFWQATSIGTNVRHAFSLDTCNGCHGGETKSGVDLPFVHIDSRDAGAQSALSKFLIGSSASYTTPNTYTMPDPITGTGRSFGDLARRRGDLATLANSTCTTSGLLDMATFKEVTSVH